MKNHDGCKRGFYQLSKAWYGESNLRSTEKVDEITIGYYHPDGGTSGEFQISWEKLCGNIVPKLEVWDDGWSALSSFSDMIDFMATIDGENIAPDLFAENLRKLGIEDMTPTQPNTIIERTSGAAERT